MRSRRAGYTLMELVLVVALLVVLTGLSYPTIEGMYAHLRVKAAADAVRSAWALARSRAMDEARPYRFAVIPNQGNFRVAPDTSDYWAGGAVPTMDATSPALVMDGSLPAGIRFVDQADAPDPGGSSVLSPESISSSAFVAKATFLPDGTAQEDLVEIVLRSTSKPIVIRLRGLTGAVTVR